MLCCAFPSDCLFQKLILVIRWRGVLQKGLRGWTGVTSSSSVASLVCAKALSTSGETGPPKLCADKREEKKEEREASAELELGSDLARDGNLTCWLRAT